MNHAPTEARCCTNRPGEKDSHRIALDFCRRPMLWVLPSTTLLATQISRKIWGMKFTVCCYLANQSRTRSSTRCAIWRRVSKNLSGIRWRKAWSLHFRYSSLYCLHIRYGRPTVEEPPRYRYLLPTHVSSCTIKHCHVVVFWLKFRLNFPVEGGTIRVLEKDLCLSGYHVPKGVSNIFWLTQIF